MRKPLSRRQQTILNYISRFIETNHYPPTVREIGEGVELKSSSTVQNHLERLRANGYVTWQDGKTRTLQIIKEEAIAQ